MCRRQKGDSARRRHRRSNGSGRTTSGGVLDIGIASSRMRGSACVGAWEGAAERATLAITRRRPRSPTAAGGRHRNDYLRRSWP
ncbi:hypothetical protein A0H81_09505 [Grifola frondosa]|uniref:Uncharacterized protein n=1 Tax=Grifola frondosa TaxID=5627 RepID=A0A1C7M191_GRIFR|nr:hypothetical protein A0H81_09505 [Grifola frondosa]